MVRRVLVPAVGLLGWLAGCGAHPKPSTVAEPGAVRFKSYCAACHQYDGRGMGDAPPLDRSPWVVGPEDRLIRIVLHGIRGRIEMNGKTWNQEMPAFGPIMSDADVSELLSYVRHRFGEPSAPITRDAVSLVRETNKTRNRFWTVEELDQPAVESGLRPSPNSLPTSTSLPSLK